METETETQIPDDLDQFSKQLSGEEPESSEPVQTDDPPEADSDSGQKAAEEEQEGESAEPGEVESDHDEDEKQNFGLKRKTRQGRMNELYAKWREEERQRQALEERLQTLEQGQSDQDTSQEQGQQEELQPPDPNDTEKYPYGEVDQQYIDDRAAYIAEKRFRELSKEERERQERERQEAEQRRQAEAVQKEWDERKQSAAQKYSDFEEKVEQGAAQGTWPCTQEMAQAIMTSDNGPDVAYHLASNSEEAQQIAQMSAMDQIRAIGRLEARYAESASQKTGNSEKAEAHASGPEPPRHRARGAGGKFTVPDDTDKLEDFEKKFFAKS